MEIILTGAPISGLELSRYGLVNTALPAEEILPQALELASTIAAFSGPVAQLCKAAITQGGSGLSSSRSHGADKYSSGTDFHECGARL